MFFFTLSPGQEVDRKLAQAWPDLPCTCSRGRRFSIHPLTPYTDTVFLVKYPPVMMTLCRSGSGMEHASLFWFSIDLFSMTCVLLCIIFQDEPLLHAAVRFDHLRSYSWIVKSPHEVGAKAGVWCPGNMVKSHLSEGVGLGPCAVVRTPFETTGHPRVPITNPPTTYERPVLSMAISEKPGLSLVFWKQRYG